MTEEWRLIPGLDGYEASSFGRVRSWRRQSGGRLSEPRIRALDVDRDGYAMVAVQLDGKRVRRRVSHLVLEAFKGPRPDGLEARHLDGNNTRDHADNLEWSLHLDNIQDKYAHGTMPAGDAHWSRRMPERRPRGERKGSKLNNDKVRDIRRRRAAGETLHSIAALHGIDHALVGRIHARKAWAHVEDAP